jgi:hypothetical protein
MTRGARLLGSVAAVLEERRQIGTVDEHGPPPVNSWQSLFNPSPDGVLVDTQEPGCLIDAITTVDLGEARIRSAPLRSAQRRFWRLSWAHSRSSHWESDRPRCARPRSNEQASRSLTLSSTGIAVTLRHQARNAADSDLLAIEDRCKCVSDHGTHRCFRNWWS